MSISRVLKKVPCSSTSRKAIRKAIRRARVAEKARLDEELARAIFRDVNGLRRKTRATGEHRPGLANGEVETFAEYQRRLGTSRGARQWVNNREPGKQCDWLQKKSDLDQTARYDTIDTDVDDNSSDPDYI